MAPESREVTAVSTPNGHFEWTHMPFGLKGAPLTFQRTMNSIFGDMLGNFVCIYLYDIIIASKEMTSHMETLKSVLKRLQDVGLKLRLTKCVFLKPRIEFLGHEVDEQSIHTVDEKTAAVAKFPQPKTVENVRSFLGLAGYCRPFIKNFAARAKPLRQLLKKESPFHWGSEQESSFKDLKHALTHASVLVFPSTDNHFVIFTNTSGISIGAVLMQTDGAGKQHVIAFASRVLTAAEKKISYSLRDSGGGLGTEVFSRHHYGI